MPTQVEITLSIVLVSFNGGALLRRSLAALAPQLLSTETELLVVGRWQDGGELDHWMDRFPQFIWLTAPAAETVPQMRWRGIMHSRGRLVALLEDDCEVAGQWCVGIQDAHRQAHLAIGGAVEPDEYGHPRDWAVFFCEYARFMRPFAGPVAVLPGNNVSYKRDRLLAMFPTERMAGGFYETFAHRQLQQSGEILLADPRVTVRVVNRWTRDHAMRLPYHHGRGFAGLRAARLSLWHRLLFAGLSPGLPVLIVGRIMRELLRRRRSLGSFLLALPWIVLFAASWALGESLGYLLGPGDSVARWR